MFINAPFSQRMSEVQNQVDYYMLAALLAHQSDGSEHPCSPEAWRIQQCLAHVAADIQIKKAMKPAYQYNFVHWHPFDYCDYGAALKQMEAVYNNHPPMPGTN